MNHITELLIINSSSNSVVVAVVVVAVICSPTYVPVNVDLDTCLSVINALLEKFAPDFVGVRMHTFPLLPLSFPWKTSLSPFRENHWSCFVTINRKWNFRISSPLSFFRVILLLSINFQKYIAHVPISAVMFGSIYCCGRLVSKLRHTRFHNRPQISNRHLNDILLLYV